MYFTKIYKICKIKYQAAKVINETGIPIATIKLQSLGSKLWDAAIMAAVIIGAIAASKIEISIISPLWWKRNL